MFFFFLSFETLFQHYSYYAVSFLYTLLPDFTQNPFYYIHSTLVFQDSSREKAPTVQSDPGEHEVTGGHAVRLKRLMEGFNPASVMKMDQMKTHTHTHKHIHTYIHIQFLWKFASIGT